MLHYSIHHTQPQAKTGYKCSKYNHLYVNPESPISPMLQWHVLNTSVRVGNLIHVVIIIIFFFSSQFREAKLHDNICAKRDETAEEWRNLHSSNYMHCTVSLFQVGPAGGSDACLVVCTPIPLYVKSNCREIPGGRTETPPCFKEINRRGIYTCSRVLWFRKPRRDHASVRFQQYSVHCSCVECEFSFMRYSAEQHIFI